MVSDIVISGDDFRRLRAMIRVGRQRRRRIGYLNALERELRRARIVPPADVPGDAVTMNSTVRVCDLQSGGRQVFRVVYPHEAGSADALSVLTPLGTAILGVRAGKVVHALMGIGARRLEVEKVLYQPEAAGDFHL